MKRHQSLTCFLFLGLAVALNLALLTTAQDEWNPLPVIPSDDKLVDADGLFGTSVSLSPNGKIMVVGVPGDDIETDSGKYADAGSALVFTKNGDFFQFNAKLIPSLVKVNGSFGYVVAASDEFICVGAPGPSNSIEETAYIYMFRPYLSSWIEQAAFDNRDQKMGWGRSLAIWKNIVWVSAYSPKNDNSFVGFIALLPTVSASYLYGLIDRYGLGTSLAINEVWGLAGSPLENNRKGAAILYSYSYYPSDSNVTPLYTINVSVQNDSYFGSSVALVSNSMVAIGCANFCNKVYIFSISSKEWSLSTTLTSLMARYLGSSLSFSSSFLVAGDYGKDTRQAFVFSIVNDVWSDPVLLVPKNGSEGVVDYGITVAASNSFVVVSDTSFIKENATCGGIFPFKFGDIIYPTNIPEPTDDDGADEEGSSDEDSAAALIGGVVATIAGVSLVAGGAMFYRKRASLSQTESEDYNLLSDKKDKNLTPTNPLGVQYSDSKV